MQLHDSTHGAAALARFVRDGDLFVLTGAGLSTESGIPDYRRADGTRRTIPMTFSEFRGSERARQRYWIRSTLGWERFARAEPNVGHEVVARWQDRGLLTRVVTQNVDGLHAAAGARDVTELHGSLDTVRCLACDAHVSRAAFQEHLKQLNPQLPAAVELLADGDAAVDPQWEAGFVLAPCPRCGSTLVKPDVVMFGENVEPTVVADCFSAVARSRACLVLGSSLKVMSGYRFVRAARAAGKPVALVGLGSMRGEEDADLVVRAPLGATLPRAETLLTTNEPGSDPA